MYSINQQDLFNIPGVNSLDQESAATVSGGNLQLSNLANGKGARVTVRGRDADLGKSPGVSGFGNRASWYEVSGRRDWIVWTGKNFTGNRRVLRAGSKNNFSGIFNNNIESARPA